MLSPAASTCAEAPCIITPSHVHCCELFSYSFLVHWFVLSLSSPPSHPGAGFDWEHELSFRPASRLSWQYLSSDAVLLVSGAGGQTNIRSAPPSLQWEPWTQGHLSTQGPLSVSRGPVKFSVIPLAPVINFCQLSLSSLSLTYSLILYLCLCLAPWQWLYVTFYHVTEVLPLANGSYSMSTVRIGCTSSRLVAIKWVFCLQFVELFLAVCAF